MSILILFYINIITLNSNVVKLHTLVRMSCIRHTSLSMMVDSTSEWRDSHECKVAVMHANSILDIGARLHTTQSHTHTANPFPDTQVSGNRLVMEIPYLAIYVYLAVITL